MEPQAKLEKAFGRLKPKHQRMILMTRVERLTYAEVAERLGITTGEVERRLADALCALDRAVTRAGRPWWRLR